MFLPWFSGFSGFQSLSVSAFGGASGSMGLAGTGKEKFGSAEKMPKPGHSDVTVWRPRHVTPFVTMWRSSGLLICA